jgi:hypothetical protein
MSLGQQEFMSMISKLVCIKNYNVDILIKLCTEYDVLSYANEEQWLVGNTFFLIASIHNEE